MPCLAQDASGANKLQYMYGPAPGSGCRRTLCEFKRNLVRVSSFSSRQSGLGSVHLAGISITMLPLLPPVVESDESAALDDSTAPTTPEGSLSFSPELRPQGDSAYPALQSQNIHNGAFLSLALLDVTARAVPPVRNICCVGAGFVGELSPPPSSSRENLLTWPRWPNRRRDCFSQP